MGDVIEFRPVASGARSRRSASETSGESRLLLFTGVRYERHADVVVEAPTATPAPSSSKPRVPRRRKKQA